MKVSKSLVLALLAGSVLTAQVSFADDEESIESTQAERAELGDELGDVDSLAPSRRGGGARDHRGAGNSSVRGHRGHRGGGYNRPAPSPIVRDHRGGGYRRPAPSHPIVVRPPVVRPRPGYRPYPGWRPAAPVVVRYHRSAYPWAPWRHRFVVRNYYQFDWRRVAEVTCTARSPEFGYDYQVTEAGYRGESYQSVMLGVENAVLDRCYAESGDEGCYLVGCSPTYRHGAW